MNGPAVNTCMTSALCIGTECLQVSHAVHVTVVQGQQPYCVTDVCALPLRACTRKVTPTFSCIHTSQFAHYCL